MAELLNNPQQNLDFEEEISLKDIYYILRRNFRLIFIASFAVLLITTVFTLLATPVYESSALMMIEEPNKAMSVFDIGLSSDMNLLTNEMEILKSRTMAEEVVQELWNSPHRNNLFLFGTRVYQPEGLRLSIRRLLTFGLWEPDTANLPRYSGEIPDSVLAATVRSLRSNMDVSNQRNTNMLSLTLPASDPDEAALIVNTFVKLYQQRDQAISAGEVINLKQFLEEQSQKVEKDLARVEDSLRSFQEKEQIFGLDGNADLLLQQLSDIESKYYTTLAGINILKERKRYMMDQLSQEEKQLAGNLLSSINDRVFALRTEIAQTEADLVRNASLYGEEHDLVKSNRVKIKKLKDELELQTQQLIARGLAVADPIKYRQAMIDTLLRFEGNEAGLEFRAQEYEKLVSQYNDQLNTLPAKSLHFARLERDRKVLADTYSLMRQKLEEARITQASQLGKVRIIDPAIPPEHRSKPNTKMNLLLGLILGLGLGVGGAFMAEYLDNTVKTAEEIERKHLTILGIIPSIGEGRYVKRKKRKKGDRRAETGRSEKLKVKGEKQGEVNPVSDTANGNGAGAKTVLRRQEVARLQRRLITHEDPKSPVSEAYRSLRTSIIYSSSGEPIKSILVSSPGPGEGKTTTIANLAITYANLGKRTLLIDSDLRRPVLHRVFGVHRDPGITHYLSGETETFDELVQETEIQNLAIVTAGAIPPNPSELLGSERMLKTVARLEQEWDIVLFDSPPLIAVTDAAMVSKEIDRIILVVKSGVTDKNAFNHTLQVLQNVEAPLGGIVLNAVTSKNSYGSYYYYYQYYHYYGDSKG